jgi:hypothetical protein
MTNAPTIPSKAYQVSFGRKTEASDATIGGLVNAHYTDFNQEGNDYPDMLRMQKKGRLPNPNATKASRGQDIRLEGTSTGLRMPSEKRLFKMKKFQNVEPAVFQ